MSDIVEDAERSSIGRELHVLDSIDGHHLGHMCPLEHSFHIRFLDRIHSGDAHTMSEDICVLEFIGIFGAHDRSEIEILPSGR